MTAPEFGTCFCGEHFGRITQLVEGSTFDGLRVITDTHETAHLMPAHTPSEGGAIMPSFRWCEVLEDADGWLNGTHGDLRGMWGQAWSAWRLAIVTERPGAGYPWAYDRAASNGDSGGGGRATVAEAVTAMRDLSQFTGNNGERQQLEFERWQRNA